MCLFYKEQYGIDLPSFTGDYTSITDVCGIGPLFGKESRNWLPCDAPIEGDVVVFKLRKDWGHVGVMLEKNRFLHIFGRTAGSTVERLNGFFHAKPRLFFRHPRRNV